MNAFLLILWSGGTSYASVIALTVEVRLPSMNIFLVRRGRSFHVCCRLYPVFFGLYPEIAADPIEEFFHSDRVFRSHTFP